MTSQCSYTRCDTSMCTFIATYLLTACSRVLLEKLTGLQVVKKFPAFMEPEGSLPQSQVLSTFLYPEPAQSSLCPHIPLPDVHLNFFLLSIPDLSLVYLYNVRPFCLFFSRFPSVLILNCFCTSLELM